MEPPSPWPRLQRSSTALLVPPFRTLRGAHSVRRTRRDADATRNTGAFAAAERGNRKAFSRKKPHSLGFGIEHIEPTAKDYVHRAETSSWWSLGWMIYLGNEYFYYSLVSYFQVLCTVGWLWMVGQKGRTPLRRDSLSRQNPAPLVVKVYLHFFADIGISQMPQISY